jgi:glucosamine--fructose-6-phosphate aminotransferase (isomerizing)
MSLDGKDGHMLLHDEIHEQPAVLERVLSANVEAAGAARKLIARSDVDHVVIAARGTSDNAARYAKYVWGSKLGVPVTLAAPSLYTRYDAPPSLKGACVVGISQSGQSPDLIAVLQEGRRHGRPTISIVNETDSPLAELADLVVPLHAGKERSVAATKSYTASLLSIAMISDGGAVLTHIPSVVADTLAVEEQIVAEVGTLGAVDRAVVLGRGFNHSTAFEWGLKLQEMAYVFAHAFSTADFAHGPFAVLEPGFPVFAVLPDGAISEDSLAILRRASEEGGAHVSVITNTAINDLPSVRTPAIEEWLSPITFITAAQLFTLHLATQSGVDPETPRGLKKVTKTA